MFDDLIFEKKPEEKKIDRWSLYDDDISSIYQYGYGKIDLKDEQNE